MLADACAPKQRRVLVVQVRIVIGLCAHDGGDWPHDGWRLAARGAVAVRIGFQQAAGAAQATAAAQDHERALSATSEAAVGWQQRASAAEAESAHLSRDKSRLEMDLMNAQQELRSALSKGAALEAHI